MDYTRSIIRRHGKPHIRYAFPPSSMLLETLLETEPGRGRYLIEQIRSILAGSQPPASSTGNVCTTMIGLSRCVILDSLSPDGIGAACVVDTLELLELLEAWRADRAAPNA